MFSPPSPGSFDGLTSPTTPSTSQRPHFQFAPYGSSPRPSTSSGYHVRRSSTASSISATLDAAATAPVNELAQNAISTLLSPPIVRTGLIPHTSLAPPPGHRAPTARDIPPVNLTTIPHVESSVFRPYLAQVGPVFESFKRGKIPGDDAPQSSHQADSPRTSYFDPIRRRKGSDAQSIALSPVRTPSQGLSPPVSPSERPRRSFYAPTPLTTIPSVYFEDNFQLENPRTFDIVSERSDIIPQPPPSSRDDSKGANGSLKGPAPSGRKALHTNAILQEKLSWYMDTVEVHLISSIATASASFFAALGSLKELQGEATDSIGKIHRVRLALKTLDEDMAISGLEIVNLRRRRENLRKLGYAVDQLYQVIDDAQTCEELVDSNLLDEANAQLDALDSLITGTPTSSTQTDQQPPRIDLRRLKALSGISEGVGQLKFRIARGFESRFIETLLADLRQHVERVPSRDTVERWANASIKARGEQVRAVSSSPAYLRTNDQMRVDLLAALAGLTKVGSTARVAVAYREAIMREIKGLIRRHLPSANDDDAESVTSISTRGGRRMNTQEKSVILSRNLRALDPEGAEELLVKIYTAVGEALRRLGVQVKVILDVTSSTDQPASSKNPRSPPMRASTLSPDRIAQGSGSIEHARDEMTQILDLSSLLGQAVDNVQTQVTKILKVRTEQTSRLSLPEFLRYFTLNRLFADECEAVSGRSGDALKEAVNSSIRDFLQNFAESETQRVVQVLEGDRWEPKDFGPADKARLDRILDSMTKTPKLWMDYTRVWEAAKPNQLDGEGATVNGDVSTEKARSAIIDEQRYILVESSVSVLRGIESFLILMAGIPSLTPDAATKMLEYLKAFNSRCCQLILGAGATRSAGLKNILTKHLALASQTCSFVVALVPYVREFIRKQAPTTAGNALAECDRVKRLFQDHQVSIHEKLVDIMSQRCKAHLNAMRKIDWDADPRETQPPISSYMESLTKETGTLHRVLARHVSEMDLSMVMTPIFAYYAQEWTQAFSEAHVSTEAGKARMLRDVEHFDARVGKIDGSKDLCAALLNIVRDKHIEHAPAPEQPTAQVEPTTDTTTTTAATAPAAAADADVATSAEAAHLSTEQVQEAATTTTTTTEDSEPALVPGENAGEQTSVELLGGHKDAGEPNGDSSVQEENASEQQ